MLYSLLLATLSYAVSGHGFTPVIYSDKPSTKCGQGTNELLMEAIQEIQHQLGPPGCNPPRNRSCQEILYCFPSASSDYYQIHAANGSIVPVYCNMEGTNCGNTTGWTRVAYLNMTQPGATCPQVLNRETRSGLTLCYRNGADCQSIVYSTLGQRYSQVCGQVRAYQFSSPDGFVKFLKYNGSTVNSVYFDGVSITYGNPSDRKHIWTYVGGATQDKTTKYDCPCNTGNSIQAPPFVGNDFYCESASNFTTISDKLYNTDPLWDGQECILLEGPCCTHPNMPWFKKTLNQVTSENIELRLCFNRPVADDTPLQIIELYVR